MQQDDNPRAAYGGQSALRRWISAGSIAASGICLTVALLLSAALGCAFDRAFYSKTYAELAVAEELGTSPEDLMRATDALLGYCRGERDDLHLTITAEGETRQAFNAREIAHMADVRHLAASAGMARDALLAAFAALLLAGLAIGKRGLLGALRPLGAGLVAGLLLMAGVGAYAALDFAAFWTRFHLVFFTNDLWLLDPATSILIRMVPEALFFRLVMRILLWFGGTMVALIALCVAGGAWHKRRALERKNPC